MAEEEKKDETEKAAPEEGAAAKEEKKPEPPKPKAAVKEADTKVKDTFTPVHYERPKQGLVGKLLGKSKISGNEFLSDGNLLLNQREYATAICAFETALAGDPTLTEAYVGLGKALAGLGGIKNAKAAVAYFYRALDADFTREEVYDALVKMYQKLGDSKRAHLERKKLQSVRILKADPSNPIANNNLGVIQLNQGHFEGAIRSFDKARKGESSNHISQYNLANAWYQKAPTEEDPHDKKKDLAKAYAEVELYMQQGPKCEGLLLKARIYMEIGNYKKASVSCDEALKLDFQNKDALNAKIIIEEKLGNVTEASEAYDQLNSLK